MFKWRVETIKKDGRKTTKADGRRGRYGMTWDHPNGKTLWAVYQDHGDNELAKGFESTTELAQKRAEELL